MKIVASDCWVEHFTLKESYSIAYEDDISHCDNIFLTLDTDDGYIGWGMAAPDDVDYRRRCRFSIKCFFQSN